MSELRTAQTKLEFPYTRTVGPVVGAFLEALRQQRLLGIRGADGRVICPPVEYDPSTGEALTELVDVGPGGTVLSWTWVAEPTSKHPLDRPFAFALIRPDGADTAMVHAVDAGEPGRMSSGMRVVARWKAEPKGLVTDLESWEPER